MHNKIYIKSLSCM